VTTVARGLTLDDVDRVVAATCFPDLAGDGAIGLEVEVLPVTPAATHVPDRPSVARGHALLVELASRATGEGLVPGDRRGVPGARLAGGGWITFEPGGQLEVSPSYGHDPSAVVDRVDDLLGRVAAVAAEEGIALLSIGCDPWCDDREVAQQLTAPRYPAMAAYLDARGSAGRRMMRHTAAVQLNLDPGTGSARVERWLVANLAAPLATATFACSPAPGGVRSRRARTWAGLDPTRTGLPRAVLDGRDDLVGAMAEAALDADVLLVRRTGRCVPGRPGWRFGDWVRHGHPRFGPPTDDDLRYHLSTLFHEVRPRGPLEIRSVDAVPARWRAVPAVLYAGMLHDDRARGRVLDVLAPVRDRLPEVVATSLGPGVADPATCALAVEVWSLALAGARRLPTPPEPRHLRATEAFLDRFTTRGRTPADELASRLDDSAAVVAWAREPLPSTVGSRR
jgi:glutamate--cysteine ligase